MAEVAVLKLSQLSTAAKKLRGVDKTEPKYLELKNSIAKHGLQNAISAHRILNGDGTAAKNSHGEETFEVVEGGHRLMAHADLGIDTIPVNIVSVNEADQLATQIAANAIRVDTKMGEYAQALKQILQYSPMTHKELGAKVGKSEEWVIEVLRLNKLPDSVLRLLDDNKITCGNAIELAKLPTNMVDDFLSTAMTEPTATFAPKISSILKQVRKSKMEAKPLVPVFTPHMSVRRAPVLKEQLDSFEKTGTFADFTLEGLTTPAEAALAVFKWVVQLDTKSVEAQKSKWDAEQQKQADNKARREAEKAAKTAAIVGTPAAN